MSSAAAAQKKSKGKGKGKKTLTSQPPSRRLSHHNNLPRIHTQPHSIPTQPLQSRPTIPHGRRMGMLRSQTILHGKDWKSRLLATLSGTRGEDVDTAEDHAAAVDVVEGFASVVTVTAFPFVMKRRRRGRRRRRRGSLFAEFSNGNVFPIEAFDGMIGSSDGWVVGKSAHHLCHHCVGSLAAPENVAAWKLLCVYMCVCIQCCVSVYQVCLLQVKVGTDKQGNAGLYTVLTCGLDAISSARGANAAATSGSSWSGIF